MPTGVYTSPLWTEFVTHSCENITFPQLLLRTVKKTVDSSTNDVWGFLHCIDVLNTLDAWMLKY